MKVFPGHENRRPEEIEKICAELYDKFLSWRYVEGLKRLGWMLIEGLSTTSKSGMKRTAIVAVFGIWNRPTTTETHSQENGVRGCQICGSVPCGNFWARERTYTNIETTINNMIMEVTLVSAHHPYICCALVL